MDAYRQVRDIVEGHEDLREEAAKTGAQIASLISITVAFVAISVALVEMVF
jgi:hypothetical protein